MLKQLRSFMTLILSVVTIGTSTAAIESNKSTVLQENGGQSSVFFQSNATRATTTIPYVPSRKKLSFFDKISVKLMHKYALQPEKTEGSGNKIRPLLALLLGLGSLVTLWMLYWVGALMAIAAIVLGIIALKKEKAKGLAILGIGFGGLTLLLILAFIILGSFSFS
jgi:Flp pilus assembly protein TadB